MEQITIAAKPRKETGTHAVNKLRREGKVPGVVYGHQFGDPLPVVIEARDLRSALAGHNINSVFTLEIEGRGATPVMVHERQHDVIDHHLIHIDLVRREIAVEALPGQIPEQIEVDVSNLNIGDNIHVRELTAPSGVKIVEE